MRIFRFSDPLDRRYAVAVRRGTWTKDEHGHSVRIPPLLIEWEPGSTEIGDFCWPGFGDEMAVKRNVAEELRANFSGFELHEVQYVARAKGSKRRLSIPFPYTGPKLVDLQATRNVTFNPARSTVVRDDSGRFLLVGGERFESYLDENRGRLEKHIPREAGRGLYVFEQDLSGDDFFKVSPFNWIFCTGRVVDFIRNRNLTNVSFLEMGELEPKGSGAHCDGPKQ
jgi:hypothetical protein